MFSSLRLRRETTGGLLSVEGVQPGALRDVVETQEDGAPEGHYANPGDNAGKEATMRRIVNTIKIPSTSTLCTKNPHNKSS